MKSLFATATVLTLIAAVPWASEKQAKDPQTITSEQTASHGTAVEFVTTPVKAAKLAAQQKKLVMVLHVSGYFEDPDFT